MKTIRQSMFWLLCSFLLIVSCAQSKEIPESAFRVGEVQLLQTTLDDVQKQFGTSNLSRGKSEDSLIEICYVHKLKGKNAFVVFETGPMGGFRRVTGFRLSVIDPKKDCAETNVDLLSLSTADGISLNLSKREFLKKMPILFNQQGSNLNYEMQSKREASKEELEKMRTMWPKETQTFFDVVTSINATFDKGRLTNYYISKIESY
jgi:hypothetical protein